MAAPGGRAGLSRPVSAVTSSAAAPPPIRQLAPEVADAIAAGEVIERPASVVKELIENSLDAGARRITVEILGGGVELVRVVDDGWGVPTAEFGLALQRHATSKLRVIADLARGGTLGFRGEALASIAAVARLLIISRPPGAGAGARLEAAAGHVGEVAPVGAAPGSTVEVRDLFFNTPARRAFLRSPRTEAAAALRVAAEAALSRPDVRFEVRQGGRRSLVTSGDGDLLEATRGVLGRGGSNQLVPVNWMGQRIAVVGLLGAPGQAQPNRQSLVLMVNGRRVHQRALVAAVEGAYRGLLEVGRHPLGVLDLRCDPLEVDVNVHPAKREVRFRQEGEFFEAVQRACWEALREVAPARLELASSRLELVGHRAGPWGTGGEVERGSVQAEEPPGPPGEAVSLAEAANWRFLGQAHQRYLVLETERGLALLDQHAAHEKVLYARILESLAKDGSQPRPAQGMLQPVLLELGVAAVAELLEQRELLRRAGFEVEAFGEGTVRCTAVPVGTRLSELGALLGELLGRPDVPGQQLAQRWHRLAASVACHTAIRFGDPIKVAEVEALLRDLAETPGGVTCPHGRPALLLLSEAELLGAFRRPA